MNSTENTLIDLSYLPANKLHNDLLDLTTQERRISAEVIEYIAEVDRRKLFAELYYPSLRAHPKNPFVHEKLEGRAGQASAGKGYETYPQRYVAEAASRARLRCAAHQASQ